MPPEAALAWPAPWAALGALATEAACGYPAALHRRLPHPVVWIGGLIAALEAHWNRSSFSDVTRRLLGVATLLIVVGAAGGAGWLFQRLGASLPFGWLLVLLAATTGLAQRSLHDHVRAVLVRLEAGDLAGARAEVAKIVGRDTAALEEHGVAAAALESLAESFNDGVVAPAFWLAIGGLPSLFAYKAVNTADSQIGHMEPRWRAFGWAAARTDDLMNLAPARLAGALLAAAGLRGFGAMLREAPRHASPNAGWPEAAMADALRITLGGSAAYDGILTERQSFGAGPAPSAAHLRRGLALYRRGLALLWLILLALGGLLWRR